MSGLRPHVRNTPKPTPSPRRVRQVAETFVGRRRPELWAVWRSCRRRLNDRSFCLSLDVADSEASLLAQGTAEDSEKSRCADASPSRRVESPLRHSGVSLPAVRLEALLEDFFAETTLEYACTEHWKGANDKEPSNLRRCTGAFVSKQLRVHRKPLLLLLHLKRFVWRPDPQRTGACGLEKLRRRVILPLELSLDAFLADGPAEQRRELAAGVAKPTPQDGFSHERLNAVYRLKAVIVHLGNKPNEGHYVTFYRVRQPRRKRRPATRSVASPEGR